MIEITCKCQRCGSKIDPEEVVTYCDDCDNEIFTTQEIEEAINSVSDKDYHWTSKDIYDGFDTEKEKEIFMKGVKHGFCNALFWVCDYFDCIEYFEDNIEDKFRRKEVVGDE